MEMISLQGKTKSVLLNIPSLGSALRRKIKNLIWILTFKGGNLFLGVSNGIVKMCLDTVQRFIWMGSNKQKRDVLMKEGSVISLSTHYQHKDERILYVVVCSCSKQFFSILY
jgi:hypothetical protein